MLMLIFILIIDLFNIIRSNKKRIRMLMVIFILIIDLNYNVLTLLDQKKMLINYRQN